MSKSRGDKKAYCKSWMCHINAESECVQGNRKRLMLDEDGKPTSKDDVTLGHWRYFPAAETGPELQCHSSQT